MITHFQALDGYAAALPALKNRRFNFGPGLNILYGPNASGKSTILRLCAAYCSIENGGWSRFPKPILNDEVCYPHRLAMRTQGRTVTADVGWDGTPSFFGHTGGDSDSITHQGMLEAEDSPDGMTSFEEQMALRFATPSNGQLRLGKMHMWAEQIKKGGPSLNGIPNAQANDVWVSNWRAFIEHCVGLGQKGPKTILLDEPDRSLGMEMQSLVWRNFIGSAAKSGFQVIVATHSLVPVLLKGKMQMVWHDMEEGYAAKTLNIVNSLLREPGDFAPTPAAEPPAKTGSE